MLFGLIINAQVWGNICMSDMFSLMCDSLIFILFNKGCKGGGKEALRNSILKFYEVVIFKKAQ